MKTNENPNAYLGHLPGSGIQAHSAADHFATYGIIMEARIGTENGRTLWVATKGSRVLCSAYNYERVLNAGIAMLRH